MGQPDNVSSDVSRDVDIKGQIAEPRYGRGATFYDPGAPQILKHDPGQIESVFASILDDCIRYRMTYEPTWDANYMQYHGETEDSSRAEWQSQVHVPTTAQGIDRVAARITSVMFGQEEWVDPPEGDGMQYEIAKELVRWQLAKAEAQDPINQSVKDALICGNGVLKLHVETQATPSVDARFVQNPPRYVLGIPFSMGGKWKFVDSLHVERRLRLEPVVMTDFWLDSSGQNRFYIQRIKVLPSDVWAKARPLYGPDGKTVIRPAIYDERVASTVKAGQRDARLDQKAAIIRHEGPLQVGIAKNTVDIYEFWGDMIDPSNGAVLYENILATFLDKRLCLRPPTRNPFLHRRRPYIYIRGKLLPHQIYGYGVLGHTVKLQDELDRFLRTCIDKTHLSIPIPVIKPRRLMNPEELMGAHMRLSPGKALMERSGVSDETPPVTVVKFSEPINEWEIQLYNILKGELNAALGVDEFVDPSQATNVRKTRLEVQTKNSSTQAIFNDAAQYIEQTGLSPLVDMVYQLMVQFIDQYDDEELMARFSDDQQAQSFLRQLTAVTSEERWRMMKLRGHFKVTGVTVQVTRQQLLARLQQFMEMVQADPTYGQIINKTGIMKILLRVFDLPRDEVLLNDWEQMLQAVREQALAAASAPQGQPGPMGNNPNNQRAAMGARGRQAAQEPQGTVQ